MAKFTQLEEIPTACRYDTRGFGCQSEYGVKPLSGSRLRATIHLETGS